MKRIKNLILIFFLIFSCPLMAKAEEDGETRTETFGTLDLTTVNAENTDSEITCREDYISNYSENEDSVLLPLPFTDRSQYSHIESGFGYRNFGGYKFHQGLDMITYGGTGTEVASIADGTVVEVNDGCANNEYPNVSSYCLGGGNYILVESELDIHGETINILTAYLHLSPNSLRVSYGDEVQEGEWIANQGNSGISTGSHLHLQIGIREEDWEKALEIYGNELGESTDICNYDSSYIAVNPALLLDFEGERDKKILMDDGIIYETCK